MQHVSFKLAAVSTILALASGCAQMDGGFDAVPGTGAAGASAALSRLPKEDEARIAPVLQSMSPAEQEAFRRAYREGERNAVLNLNELGLAAMEAGNLNSARLAFDEALRRVDAIYSNDANARKAKSVFVEEKAKDFKGEPYERAMAHYYRGLLYLGNGDYQNARASFLAADYQDTVAEKEVYQGDFGLMTYLAAWASACDGDPMKAKELFAAGAAKDPSIRSLTPQAPMLYIVETGRGPTKVGTGKHREVLTFGASPASEDRPLALDAQAASTASWIKSGDIQYQATTRGGRPIQGILDGKAQFKDTTDTIGTVAMSTGVMASSMGVMGNNADMAQLGGAAALAGSLLMLASSMATPAADTRQWVSLPRDIYLLADQVVPSGLSRVELAYTSEAGAEGKASLQHWGKQGSCAVAWGRTRTGAITRDPRPLQPGKQPRDAALREDLLQKFAPAGGQS